MQLTSMRRTGNQFDAETYAAWAEKAQAYDAKTGALALARNRPEQRV